MKSPAPEPYPCYAAFRQCPYRPTRTYKCQLCWELAGNKLPRGVQPAVDPEVIQNLLGGGYGTRPQ